MLTGLAVVLVAAASPEPLKLVVLDLSVADVSREKGAYFTELLATRLGESGAVASTAKAASAVLALERQREMLGCTETSCMTEIAAALGVDALVIGELAKLGNAFEVSLKILSPSSGKALATHVARATSEEGLADAFAIAADELVAGASASLGRPAPPRANRQSHGLRTAAIATGAAGVLGVAAGAVLLGLAGGKYQAIPQTPDATPRSAAEVTVLAGEGKGLQTGGLVALGVGGAALATAAVLFVLDLTAAPATPVAAFGPNGEAFVGLAGSF